MQGRYGTSISTEIRSSRWLIPFPASALLAVHVLTPAPSVRSAWRTRLWSMLVPASIAVPARAFARPVQSTLNKQFCTPCAASCGPRFFVGGFCSFFAKKEPKKLSPGSENRGGRAGEVLCVRQRLSGGVKTRPTDPGDLGSRGTVPVENPFLGIMVKFLCFFLYKRVVTGGVNPTGVVLFRGISIPGQKVKISLLLSL